jgi:hypothetical protein
LPAEVTTLLLRQRHEPRELEGARDADGIPGEQAQRALHLGKARQVPVIEGRALRAWSWCTPA